ncbi:MAG: signal peptidase II [Sulfuricellaceae bacterium]|jgi:signal peptidase II
MPSWMRWLTISAGVIVLDQITKYWITAAFQLGDKLPVLPSFNLVLAYNTGAAFSLLADAGGWQRVFFSLVAAAASTVIVFLLRRHPHQTLFSLALALILGGALGNLIDRIALGHVIDFIQLYWRDYYWPAFNVADSAITGGAVLLVWDSFRKPAKPR